MLIAVSLQSAHSPRTLPGPAPCVFLTQNDMIHTASVGDSLAVLGRREGSNVVAVELNEILKPTMESEKMRIEKAGGEVKNGRVGGFLAVSRALGDIEFQPAVSPVPSVECVRLDPGACSVLLACDGVWDVHHSQSAVDLVEATRDPQVAGRFNAFDICAIVSVPIHVRVVWCIVCNCDTSTPVLAF